MCNRNLFRKYEQIMNIGMELFERVNALCQENGIQSVHVLEGILGFGDGTIYKWKKSAIAQSDKLTAIADYFNVSTDFLLGRESNTSTEETSLIANYRRLTDTQKDAVQALMIGFLSQNPVKKETGTL